MSSNPELQKWTCALVCGLIFLLVSAPFTYDFTNYVGEKISDNLKTKQDDGGRPTLFGLILHMIVFVLLVRLSILIPYDKLM